MNLAPHPKHSFIHEAGRERNKRERTIREDRIEAALKTDKSTWKKCKQCGELFPETNEFWVKNGKKSNGSQRYRTLCGDTPANNCAELFGRITSRKRIRTYAVKLKTWRGHLVERKAGSISSDNIRIERKVRAGTELTDFEKMLRNNVAREVHPLTIEILLDMLEKQEYKCAETGFEFTLEIPHLYNLSIDRKPGYEYHTPEGVQLVTQWYNKAVGAATREQRDMLNEDLKNMARLSIGEPN
jgi:hypothetical protein